jgi:capsular polysaccharide biosynthesis protein
MAIGDFFGALRRRWLIVLVGIVLTVGLSGAAYWFFKPTYEVTGTVLLLPPASSAINGSTNPYLQLGGLQQAVDLVGVSLSDQATTLEMKDISKDVDFTVKADVRTSSPLLVVDVKDSSPETALRIRDILMARVPVRLEEMQQRLAVSTKDRVTSSVLTLDTEAQEVGRNRLRAAVVAGVLGLGLTLLVAALWDARRLRHPRRRAAKRLHVTPDEPSIPPVAVTADPADDTVDAPDDTVDPADKAVDPADVATVPTDVALDPAEGIVGVPLSPTSPSLGLAPLEQVADAPDDAPR